MKSCCVLTPQESQLDQLIPESQILTARARVPVLKNSHLKWLLGHRFVIMHPETNFSRQKEIENLYKQVFTTFWRITYYREFVFYFFDHLSNSHPEYSVVRGRQLEKTKLLHRCSQ